MLGLGEARCGAERVTCAFTTTDLQSHGCDLNESRPRVVHVAGQWLVHFAVWIVDVAGSCNFCRPRSDSRLISLPRSGPFMSVSAHCRLPSTGLL